MHKKWILVAALLGLGLGLGPMVPPGWAVTPAGSPTGSPTGTVMGTVSIWERDPQGGKAVLTDRSNAVVFVAGFEAGMKAGFAVPQRPLKLAQIGKSFSERVLAIAQGESVAFPNADPFHHNVWSKSKARPFDLGLYKAPESRSVDFPRPGIVTVFCNIHPQMIATILVLPNPKFALTRPSGAYRIEGIPAGRYAVFAWVEGAEPVRQVLEFHGAGVVRADFTLQLKRIPIEHLDKDGKPYRDGAAKPRYSADPRFGADP